MDEKKLSNDLKSLIFIAAFLPQFIDADSSPGLQFSIIVPTFLFITFTVTSVWALVAGNVRSFLQGSWTLKPVLRTAGGVDDGCRVWVGHGTTLIPPNIGE